MKTGARCSFCVEPIDVDVNGDVVHTATRDARCDPSEEYPKAVPRLGDIVGPWRPPADAVGGSEVGQ